MQNIKFAVEALKHKHYRLLVEELRSRMWSTVTWYGFERNLSKELKPRSPRINVQVTKARPDDLHALLDLSVACDARAAKDRFIRLSMIGANIQTPYVAVTGDGIPCHMQWMIGPDENEALQRFSRGGLPIIGEDEVILENAFTLEPYRRQGIEFETVRVLFDIARQQGAQRAILFVNSDSRVSLRLVSELGFTPFCTKTCRRRMFRQHFAFGPIPPKTAQY